MRLSEIDLAQRANNLNLIRLLAATSVTFAHSFPLLNGSGQTLFGFVSSGAFGGLAVIIFFGLSGLLIAQSFILANNWRQYLEARLLRIFPALFFSSFVTIVIVSQLYLGQKFSAFFDAKNWGYFFGTAFFKFKIFSEVFTTLPHAHVNGSLWTLPVEFRHYLLTMVLGLLGFFAVRKRYLGFAIVCILSVVFKFDWVVREIFPVIFKVRSYDGAYLALPLAFGIGTLSYLYREKVYLSIIGGILAFACVCFFDHWVVKTIGCVYAAYVFGWHKKLYLPKLNFKTDLSYAIYVLSYPVQQILVHYRVADTPYHLFVYTMIIVTPLSLISWHLVEKPALRCRGKFFNTLPSWMRLRFVPGPR